MKLTEFEIDNLIKDNILLKEQVKQLKLDKEALKEQLTLTDVVKSFYCFEQSMNGYDKCGDQCTYCESLKRSQ